MIVLRIIIGTCSGIALVLNLVLLYRICKKWYVLNHSCVGRSCKSCPYQGECFEEESESAL